MDFNKILIPLDFSAASRQALAYGSGLASELGATLLVAHIVEYSPTLARAFPGASFELEKRHVNRVREKMRALIADDLLGTLDCRFVVKMGSAVDELMAVVADEEVDLVVMGTHGRRGFARWTMGSVTEYMLRTLAIPVISVSHLEKDVAPEKLLEGRILYATDLGEDSGRGLQTAFRLAERFGAELMVVHVLSPLRWEYGVEYLPLDLRADHAELHKDLSERLERSIPDSMRASGRVSWELVEGVAWEKILDAAERHESNLIVINLHGGKRAERAFLGRTAESVVRNAHRPVLGIPVS